MRIITVVGARPNLVKAAPVLAELARREAVESLLVHTGQHYDAELSEVFVRELGLPAPAHQLGVGSASAPAQTATIMQRLEGVLLAHRPGAVVVIGDVTSTVAAALTAVQLGLPVAHIEAGVRSFDRSMPEEINRVVTDAISRLLLTPTAGACANLAGEGIAAPRIRFVGNVLADVLSSALPAARCRRPWQTWGLVERRYALITVHRPANVDDTRGWLRLLEVFKVVSRRLPAVLPLHPRGARRLAEVGLRREIEALPGLVLTGPLGYLDFVALQDAAAVVLTDSGGVQVEATMLGVPCLTLRGTTEWPMTVEVGSNRLVGTDAEAVAAGVEEALSATSRDVPEIPLWDGRAAARIADAVLEPGWREAGAP